MQKSLSVSKNYNGTLDFMKLMFTIAIFFYHFNVQWGVDWAFPSGSMAVEYFFIVSGYFMAVSVMRDKTQVDNNTLGRQTLSFVWHKAKVVIPYYIFAFIISFIVYCLYYLSGSETTVELLEKFLHMIPCFFLMSATGIELTSPLGLTWYISAMLIAMMFLYPIFKKYKDIFLHIISPLVAVILLGYMSQTYGGLTATNSLDGYLTRTILRAFLDICVGCCVYVASEKLKTFSLTIFAKSALTLIEAALYTSVFITMMFLDKSLVFVMIIFLFFAVSITTSRQGILTRIFDNRLIRYSSKFSLAFYLNHSACRRFLIKSDFDLSVNETFVLYLILSLITTFACMIICSIITKLYNRYKNQIKSLVFKKQ